MNSMGRMGGHHDLLQRSYFALAHDREGGEVDDECQGEGADHARNEEPAAIGVLVVPGVLFQRDGGPPCGEPAAGAAEKLRNMSLGERRGDLADIAQRDQRGVGIGAVHRDLHRGGGALAQQLREAGTYGDGDGGAAAVDRAGHIGLVARNVHDGEPSAGGEVRDQLPAFLGMVHVQNDGRDMIDLEGRGVAEHQHLDDRRHDQPEARPLVALHVPWSRKGK